MDTVTNVLLFVLLTPLVAAAVILLCGRQRGNLAAGVSVLAAGLVAAASLHLFFRTWGGEAEAVSLQWLSLGDFEIRLGFFLNGVSALMLFVVSFVGFWIHVFSLGYMKDDAAKARFFGGLSIFMFSMLGIVVAENLFMIFVFWELVGFSSYMLIGHYFQQEDARGAAKKAFIVNRVGDFGFLLGIILVFWTFGTTSLPQLAEAVAGNPSAVTTLMGLLLFCGVLGKSAQMPLHVWLPDAMAGPTPVSALIHAATMVAAGVFFLGRTVFLYTPDALEVIAWVGVITAVCAAIWAFAQTDIKKILAYSTLSQLGFMVAAFGLGTLFGLSQGGEQALYYGVGAALFHLTTHAFFKALLFLGSGSVIHACHHEQDIFKMGGLLRKMPITGITFAIGVIAIAGIPFVAAGFFSKDAILYVAYEQAQIPFVLLAATAVLTAAYMGRLFFIAFLGKARSDNAEHAHETSWVMWLPLVVLAVFSLGGGHLFFYPPTLQPMLAQMVPHPEGSVHTMLVIFSLIASLGGLLFALLFYGTGAKGDRLEQTARPVWALSRSLFGFDALYGFYVKRVQQRVADIVAFVDTLFINGLAVRGTAGLAGLGGILARSLQTGSLHGYVWWFFGGLILFWLYAVGAFLTF